MTNRSLTIEIYFEPLEDTLVFFRCAQKGNNNRVTENTEILSQHSIGCFATDYTNFHRFLIKISLKMGMTI